MQVDLALMRGARCPGVGSELREQREQRERDEHRTPVLFPCGPECMQTDELFPVPAPPPASCDGLQPGTVS